MRIQWQFGLQKRTSDNRTTVNDAGAQKAERLLREGATRLGITLDDQSITGLVQYALELLKWNQKVNLVAKNTSLEDIVEKHFLDSLTLLPVLNKYAPETGEMLDVGSGAGFPGLVVKAARPGRTVTLLEPRLRRVSFLNHVIRLLALQGIEVVPHRTDEKKVLNDRHFQVITGRAVADVTSFLDMTGELAQPGTLIMCMQGDSGKEQWESERNNLEYSRVGIEHIRLPVSRAHRYILLFRKVS